MGGLLRTGKRTLTGVGAALVASLIAAVPAAALSSTPDQTFVVGGGSQPGVYSIAQSNGTTYVAGKFTEIGPRTGPAAAIDATSGQADLSMPQASGGDAAVYAVAPDGAGGWYLAGSFTHVGGLPRGNVAHILANKTVDPNFAPAVNGAVRAIALSGSTVYIGGDFTAVAGQPHGGLAALNASGQPTSWSPSVNSGGRVEAIVISGSHVVVGGQFSSVDGIPEDGITAIDPTTGLPTWTPATNMNVVEVDTLAVSGSTVYAGGSYSAIGGQSRTCLAALDAQSGTATSWNPTLDNNPYPCQVSSVAVSGATVYVDGDFSAVDGQARGGIAAIDATTGSPTAWNPPTNHIICCGGPLAVSGGNVYMGLSALDANTGAFTSWNPNANGAADTIAVSGSTVYAGGYFSSVNDQPRTDLAAVASDGSVTPWNPTVKFGYCCQQAVQAVAVSGSTVYVGGDFTSIGGQPRTGLAAIDASTGQPTAWNANLTCSQANCYPYVDAFALSGSNLYFGGSFTSVGGQARNNIAAIDTSTGATTSFNPSANGGVYALALSGPALYAGGRFSSIGGQPRNNIAALNSTSGNAMDWNPGANSNVFAIARSGSTVYLGGDFTSTGGQSRSRIAAVDAGSGAATAWNPGANGTVSGIAASGSTVYAGGSFTSIGGQPRSYLAGLDASSGAPTAFDPEPNGTVQTVAVTPTGALEVGGFFTTMSLAPQSGFAQFSP